MLNSNRMYTVFGKGSFVWWLRLEEMEASNLCLRKWLERRKQVMHLKSLLLSTSPRDQRRSLPNAKETPSDFPSCQHYVLCLRPNPLLTANRQ